MNAKSNALVHARWFEATSDAELHLLESQIESLKDQAGRARQRLRQKPPHTSKP